MRRKEWLKKKLLLDKPELLEKLDIAKLETAEVADTVGKFMDEQDWEHLADQCWNGWDWHFLLLLRPQMAYRCPWDQLDGSDWCHLLTARPQFADNCPWEKLEGWNWIFLLIKQPQFADNCP